nr:MAG TPA: hypothetical protein [Caudoviricetes sp.]
MVSESMSGGSNRARRKRSRESSQPCSFRDKSIL